MSAPLFGGVDMSHAATIEEDRAMTDLITIAEAIGSRRLTVRETIALTRARLDEIERVLLGAAR